MDSKSCRRCQIVKPLDQFYVRKGAKDGRYNLCAECAKTETKSWKSNLPPERKKDYARAYVLAAYNLTLEDYDAMVERQGGLCAICRKPPVRDVYLAVDHDRKCCPGKTSCGKCVRKLLCIKCNTTIAMSNEDLDILMAAHNYILEYKLSEYLSYN